MYGRACRNLSLWRKYKTNIDTLLLIFAFFNEEGSSDIQYRSRSQQCKKLDVDDFIEHILPRMQANCAYPVISGLYLFVNNDAKKVYIKQTDDVYNNLAKLCTGNVTSFLDSIVQMDYHDEYDVSCYYWSGDLCDNFDKYIDKIYQIFMDCGYEKYVCPV